MEGAQSGGGRTARSTERRDRVAAPVVPRRARRTVALPPDPASPGRARGVLRRTLREADRLDCLDAAELACTELVTNAVLHAHTTVVVTVEVADDVRVEVRDANGTLPTRRHYDPQATTGRGLALVAALTDDYGVTNAGPHGKTVWFTVGGSTGARSEDELLAAWEPGAWDLDGPEVPLRPTAPTHPVRLLGLPAALWFAAQQHHDALLRELGLYLARHDDVDVDVVGTDRARFLLSGAVRAAAQRQRRDATERPGAGGVERGTGTLPWSPGPVDVQVDVDPELARDFAAMQDALDTAERLAGTGHLLARPGLPEIVAVRDWACEQVVAQPLGVTPVPWSADDHDRAHEPSGRPGLPPDGLDLAAVAEATTCLAAADESNRLVAVSRPLARLLGWRVEDLVGRRVVALIPHRLREAHVAGFTRHQSTGEARVLGVPLTVPVLRADGTEVTCGLVLEHAPGTPGRGAYLARFDPPSGAPSGGSRSGPPGARPPAAETPAADATGAPGRD